MGRDRLIRAFRLVLLVLFLASPLSALADVATRLPGQKYPALGDSRGRAVLLKALSCSYLQTAADGTPACQTPPAPPEYVSRTMTAGGTVAAYGVVMANGSTADSVVEATASPMATQILGCSQSGSSVTSTNPLEVAVSGIARCRSDSTVAAGSLVKLTSSGTFALATTGDPTFGRAVTAYDGVNSAYILLFDGAEGTIDHKLDLWSSMPDVNNTTESIISSSPTVDVNNTAGKLVGLNLAPTSTSTNGGDLIGIRIIPDWTQNSATSAADVTGIQIGGSVDIAQTANLSGSYGLLFDTTFTSPTAGSAPVLVNYGFWNKPALVTTAPSGSATSTGFVSTYHNPAFTLNSASPSTASWTVIEDVGVKMAGSYTKTAGTALTISSRAGVQMNDPTVSGGPVVTEAYGVHAKACTVGSTIAAVRSDITASANRYAILDTGGAQSSLVGKFTKYNNITTAGTGLPIITGESGVSATKTADFTSLSYTPPATAGRYRIEQVITTTSGTNTGQLQCTVDYVDSQGTTHTADLMPMVNQTGIWATSLPVVAGASKEWHCGPTYITINGSATAIVLKVDVTTGTVNYTVAASVEQIG